MWGLTVLPLLAPDLKTRGDPRSERLWEAEIIRRAAARGEKKWREIALLPSKSEHVVDLRDLISPPTVISHEVEKWVKTIADTFCKHVHFMA